MQHNYFDKPVRVILLLLAIFCVGFFIYSFHDRIITTDDAYFAEQAYWFARDGYVHSELFEGLPIFTGHILVYHKLHVWEGAAVYKIFGWSAYYFKAIALPYMIVFLALIFYFLKYLNPKPSRKNIFIIFLFLFFANHLVFQGGFEYRPEIPMMCTGFLSYILLFHARSRNLPLYAVAAGLFAGITALFHLNGLIFIMSGGLLLLLNRQYKLAFWFGLGSVIGFLPYFYQIDSLDTFRRYLFALQHDPAVSKDDRTMLGMLKKLVLEYQRFTHHVYEFVYLLAYIITLAASWKRIMENEKLKDLLVYTLLLTASMALITTGSKTIYLLYSMPYVLLLVASQFSRVLDDKKIAPVFLSILLIYFLVNLDRNHGVINDEKNHPPQLYASITAKYQIQPGTHIFAPASFIFNEIGKVHIQSYLAYLVKFHNDLSKINRQSVLGDIYRRKKAFAILNPRMLRDLRLNPQIGGTYNGYRYLGRESDLFIFKRIPPSG